MSLNTTPRTWVSGEFVTAALMNTEVRDALTGIQAVWTSYTPTVTATTNPTNLTVTGSWLQMGKTVIAVWEIQYGATSTAGTGGWKISSPTTIANGTYMDTGYGTPTGATLYPGVAVASNFFGQNFVLYGPTASGNSALVQIGGGGIAGTAWANGGILRGQHAYQAA